jgi:RNA methyltransferase, TrmH family
MTVSKNKLQALCSLQHKKYRDQTGHYLIEGLRLCEEAVAASAAIKEILISEEPVTGRLHQLVQQANLRRIPVHSLPAQMLAKLCDTQTPQGIVAHVAQSKPSLPHWPELQEPLVLAIDHFQDPGNLGTVLRTADWFGVKTVLLGRNSVELYNPKVVRSTMGSIFRLTCHLDLDIAVTLCQLRSAGFSILAAVAKDGAPLAKRSGKTVLLIGSEAEGLSAETLQLADQRFTIPRLGSGESLNAAIAAGITLYELTK